MNEQRLRFVAVPARNKPGVGTEMMNEKEMNRVLWTLLATLASSYLFAAPLFMIGDSSNPILSRVSVILSFTAPLCGIVWVILSVLAIPRTAMYLEAVARGKQVGSLSKGLLGLLLAISPIVMYGTFLWLRINR